MVLDPWYGKDCSLPLPIQDTEDKCLVENGLWGRIVEISMCLKMRVTMTRCQHFGTVSKDRRAE